MEQIVREGHKKGMRKRKRGRRIEWKINMHEKRFSSNKQVKRLGQVELQVHTNPHPQQRDSNTETYEQER